MKRRQTAAADSRPEDLIVFLGPSLPHAEAERLAPCRIVPPARQGDVLRALAYQPRVIALIDGVFEAQPSVWHRELLAAMDAGVTVLGASSMGALRAAELQPFGMIGVGTIFQWVVQGVIEDDAEVALLHASAEHDFRPLTLPLVNVRHATALAQTERVLSAREASQCVSFAESLFYQERTWPRVEASFSTSALRRWKAWVEKEKGLPDLKREDALRCLKAASAQLSAPEQPAPSAEWKHRLPSTWLRRARLAHGQSLHGNGDRESAAKQVGNEAALAVLRDREDASVRSGAGLRRALLSGWARSRGLLPDASLVESLGEQWHAHLGADSESPAMFQARMGIDPNEARQLMEELALEAQVLGMSAQLLADGPSYDDALAAEARINGEWPDAVTQAAGTPSRRSRGPRRRDDENGSR